jgi:uncharacterized protein (DUF2141 family)
MRYRLLAATAIAMISTGAAVIAWQSRDGGVQTAANAAGAGVLVGSVVTDTASPQPVRRATVRLSGESTATSRVVGTDDDGRFVFDRLPAGTYTVSATKAGLVRSFHGSTRPGVGPGVPVAIGTGEKVDVTIRLLPGAVITGVVTNPRGQPVQGITVAAVSAGLSGSAPPAPVRVVTDDRGVYRVFGLAPGEYVVFAVPEIVPAPYGRGSALAPEVTAVSAADVQWAKNIGAVSAPGAKGASQPPPPLRPVAYAPVFYPGTTDAAGAAPVRVASGDEIGGIDVPLRIASLARVTGTTVDGGGQPITSGRQVTLVPKRGDRPTSVDAFVASGAIQLPRADVSATGFVFSGVAPGEYTLIARSGAAQRGVAPGTGPRTLWSVIDLAIDGTDRTNVSLRLLPGLSVAGRFVFEPGATPPVDPATLNLSFVAINPIPGVAATFRAALEADGTFRVPSLAPGAYFARIDPSARSGRWFLKSAVAGGRDFTDRPLAAVADGSDLSGVVVRFSDRAAELSGRVIDAGNQPVTRYSIVVVTTDRSLWLPGARRIRVASPATDGSFAVNDLPAGEYAVAAVQDLDTADLATEDFLTRLLTSAFKLSLSEGERRQQDLRAGG